MKKQTHKIARKFFKEIKAEYNMSSDELLVLESTCEQLSMYWQASDLIQSEGLTFKTSQGQIKKHPGCEISKNSFVGFLAGCRLLGICQPGEKNPGGRGNKN